MSASIYKVAASVIRKADSKQGSIKSLVFSSSCTQKKKLYALVSKTLESETYSIMPIVSFVPRLYTIGIKFYFVLMFYCSIQASCSDFNNGNNFCTWDKAALKLNAFVHIGCYTVERNLLQAVLNKSELITAEPKVRVDLPLDYHLENLLSF